jgi:hypothetical protein
MIAPVHNLDPTILPEGSAKLRWAGGGGARSALLGMAMSPKRRARTRGQNPLVFFLVFSKEDSAEV